MTPWNPKIWIPRRPVVQSLFLYLLHVLIQENVTKLYFQKMVKCHPHLPQKSRNCGPLRDRITPFPPCFSSQGASSATHHHRRSAPTSTFLFTKTTAGRGIFSSSLFTFNGFLELHIPLGGYFRRFIRHGFFHLYVPVHKSQRKSPRLLKRWFPPLPYPYNRMQSAR